MADSTFDLTPVGAFDLDASIVFLNDFVPLREPGRPQTGKALMAAFTVDGEWTPQGVHIRQLDDGTVRCAFSSPASQAAKNQVQRMLSLDIDGRPLEHIAARDPHVADLIQRAPGLRPVLFASPYEAAAWSVLSQRVRMTQAAKTRADLCVELGSPVSIGDTTRYHFPSPEQVMHAGSALPLPETQRDRLTAVARAALDGHLDAVRLRSIEPAQALHELQAIHGIGPFSAELVLIRGAGYPDAFPSQERRLRQVLSDVYHHPMDDQDYFTERAESWSPLRSWVSFLFRTTQSIPQMFDKRKESAA